MANKLPNYNSFLPSGAIDSPRFNATTGYSPRILSPAEKGPNRIPRSVPSYAPSPGHSYSSPSPGTHGGSFSPPLSRTGSTDENSAALVEDWRKYTHNLREQYRGERTHMVADRARAEEIMAEERDINEQEKALLKQENSQLRSEKNELLAMLQEYQSKYGDLEENNTLAPVRLQHSGLTSPSGLSFLNRATRSRTSPSFSTDDGAPSINDHVRSAGSSSRTTPGSIAQETGREDGGTPIWAPQSGPAARTFEHNNAVSLDLNRLELGDGLRCPTKEFHPEDFQVRSPEANDAAISESSSQVGEGVPGGNISAKLDGVILKDSCVAPAFKIYSPSPQGSPNNTPPAAVIAAEADASTEPVPIHEPPPTRTGDEQQASAPASESKASPTLEETTNRLSRTGSGERQSASELLKAPAGERLIANAGHTPVHSRSPSKHKSDPTMSSGNATPTQSKSREKNASYDRDYTLQNARQELQVDGSVPEGAVSETPPDQGDRALDSPLAMGHRANSGDNFILGLEERLAALAEEQARRGSIASTIVDDEEPPIVEKRPSVQSSEMEDLEDVIRPLKIKQSSNFGMPFGRAFGQPPS